MPGCLSLGTPSETKLAMSTNELHAKYNTNSAVSGKSRPGVPILSSPQQPRHRAKKTELPEFEPIDLHYIYPALTRKHLDLKFSPQRDEETMFLPSLVRFLSHGPQETPFSEHMFAITVQDENLQTPRPKIVEMAYSSILVRLENHE